MIELSREAATQLEVATFLLKHKDDYYNCDRNEKTMTTYMDKHRIPRTVAGHEKAWAALNSAGQLLNSVAARQTMSNEEYQRHLEWHGVPVYDKTFGHCIGKKWPEELKDYDLTKKPSDVGRVKGRGTRPAEEIFPKAERYRPTRAEYALWPADKLRVWVETNGYMNGIPANAFSD
jgi:hypothetical protein